MPYDLKDDFHWYLEHQDELVAKYDGKTLLIRDGKVFGAFDDELEAVREALKKYKFGEFLAQPCSPGADAYTIRIPLLSASL